MYTRQVALDPRSDSKRKTIIGSCRTMSSTMAGGYAIEVCSKLLSSPIQSYSIRGQYEYLGYKSSSPRLPHPLSKDFSQTSKLQPNFLAILRNSLLDQWLSIHSSGSSSKPGVASLTTRLAYIILCLKSSNTTPGQLIKSLTTHAMGSWLYNAVNIFWNAITVVVDPIFARMALSSSGNARTAMP